MSYRLTVAQDGEASVYSEKPQPPLRRVVSPGWNVHKREYRVMAMAVAVAVVREVSSDREMAWPRAFSFVSPSTMPEE
jgi:hypothetical protein